ncbi:Glycosyltransferase, GT2 family [bacterium A37T11]|nr:Glycosyltransferase, GT2 family [bacterium A37T11]
MLKSAIIDIVIPSYRLEEQYLIPLILLAKPEGWIFNYYIICDNPSIILPSGLSGILHEESVHLFVNPRNLGASESRNKGIGMGNGDWILFLDDDIVAEKNLLFAYVNALEKWGEHEIGFAGLVRLPEPHTNFGRALQVDPLMDAFSFAARLDACPWGVTANFIINRKAIGNIRFSNAYPKFGGGEDVDFFLAGRAANGCKNYRTLPEAIVHHPWWNQEVSDFKRPFRYGIGESYLCERMPQYTYRDFLNTPETLLVISLVTILIAPFFSKSLILMTLAALWVLLAEGIASFIRFRKKEKELSISVWLNHLGIRQAYEWGVLWGNISRLRLNGIGQRFNFQGNSGGPAYFKFNTSKIIKWVLYVLLVYYLFEIYS